MPTDLKNDAFLYLGESAATNAQNFSVRVPYPSQGGALFETTRMVNAARNARGEMVGRVVGRSLHKQTLQFAKIPCATWWSMNRWFENGHFTFYCHFFNHNFGRWETRLFYLGDIKTNPVRISSASGVPAYYADAVLSVIDCGVV